MFYLRGLNDRLDKIDFFLRMPQSMSFTVAAETIPCGPLSNI